MEGETHSSAQGPDQSGLGDLEWQKLTQSTTVEAFCSNWLVIQCHNIGNVTAGVVLLSSEEDKPFVPVACWPTFHKDLAHLSDAARQALEERRGCIIDVATDPHKRKRSSHIAYPFEVLSVLRGVVVLEIETTDEISLKRALRTLYWGAGRLETLIGHEEIKRLQKIIDQLVINLDVLAITVDQDGLQSSARAFVTVSAQKLQCDQVSLGLLKKGEMRVVAISNTATFNKKANVVRAIESAMEEAVDQNTSVVLSHTGHDHAHIVLAHQELQRLNEDSLICTVPLTHGGQVVGAVLFEFLGKQQPAQQVTDLCQAIGALSGPVVNLHQINDDGLYVRFVKALSEFFSKTMGLGYIGTKFVLLIILLASFYMWFASGVYRVSADATLEGSVLRAAIVPFNSYIMTADIRPGDIVHKGDVLAMLDNRDLLLEKKKWASKQMQIRTKYRDAIAKHDKESIGILTAQKKQVAAEIALANEKLARSRVASPFDGVIVSGDLSQSIGMPVERGQVLYEIAPLNSYRVVLKIDERDVRDIRLEQHGLLSLSSLPDQDIPIVIKKIMPIANASEGANYFRVEAEVTGGYESLLPGMEGVAKLDVGQRRLLWIWAHRLVDWGRLWIWEWWP